MAGRRDFAGVGHWFLLAVTRRRPRAHMSRGAPTTRRRRSPRLQWRARRHERWSRATRRRRHGGHLFPAEALAHVLEQRGVAVELVTDERALRYGDSFPARAMHTIRSATPRGGSIFSRVAAVARSLRRCRGAGVALAASSKRRDRLWRLSDRAALVAASLLRIPTVLHEANGVMGKANRFLAGRVDAIAAAFRFPTRRALRAKITVTGNPLRPTRSRRFASPIPRSTAGCGFSSPAARRGARVMADVVPAAVAALPAESRAKIIVTQQARLEDIARVADVYERAGVKAEIAPFFPICRCASRRAQLVIARSGASTVSEIAAIGRASILVPLPHALDQDQAANAAVLQATGAAEVVRQENFTARFLSERLAVFIGDPASLKLPAECAKAAGRRRRRAKIGRPRAWRREGENPGYGT